jgi:hypothetical protein
MFSVLLVRRWTHLGCISFCLDQSDLLGFFALTCVIYLLLYHVHFFIKVVALLWSVFHVCTVLVTVMSFFALWDTLPCSL